MTGNERPLYATRPNTTLFKAPFLARSLASLAARCFAARCFAATLVLSSVCCVSTFNSAFAAEAKDVQSSRQEPSSAEEKKASKATTTPKQDTAEKPKSKASQNKKDDSIFIPSEEISEDFAVSFPVDI